MNTSSFIFGVTDFNSLKYDDRIINMSPKNYINYSFEIPLYIRIIHFLNITSY